jgi:hypothetical protein
MKFHPDSWYPTSFEQHIECFQTSTGVARIITDSGEAYIKALGNKEGPHALAREWVGTSLARWLDLPTFEFAIMQVGPDDEIPLGHEKRALPGPAFVSRRLKGHQWGGTEKELREISNPHDLLKLVVFDTWILNVDRCPPSGSNRKPNYDNVFLSTEVTNPKHPQLIVIDHTHCFGERQDLTTRLTHISNVKDQRVYGLFPEFKPFLREAELDGIMNLLSGITRNQLDFIVDAIPPEWEIDAETKASLKDFLMERAGFLIDHVRLELHDAMGNDWILHYV